MIRKMRTKLPLVVAMTLCFFMASQQATAQKRKKKKAKIENVIKTARTYLGTPYQWGGMSHKGIDCSGLMYNSFKSIGIKLPRTSKEQSKTGKKKGWEAIKPGDIVFFRFKKGKEKWWHSGMVTQVGTDQIKFIHASSSRGVVESNLLSDYYKDNVKNFRRVIR